MIYGGLWDFIRCFICDGGLFSTYVTKQRLANDPSRLRKQQTTIATETRRKTSHLVIDLSDFHGDSMDFNGIYPLVNIQKAIEHGHRNSGFSH